MQNLTNFFKLNLVPIFLFILVLLLLTVTIHSHNVVGQNRSSASKVQTWIDNLSNTKTEFTYLPASPGIDTPTQLKFNIVHLQNGTHLDELLGRVIVLTTSSGQERSFIFPNIITHNGSFSVKYLFPDSGSYQVVSKINSKGFVTLASFNVFVPIPASSTGNFTTTSLLVFATSLAGIIGILAIVAFLFIRNRIKKKKRN